MSAFFSFRYADCIQLLTDGSIMDSAGVLAGIQEKVFFTEAFPFVITGRGDVSTVNTILKGIDGLAGTPQAVDSVDTLLQAIAAYFRELESTCFLYNAEFLIAAFSETRGPVHFFVQCHDGHALEAFALLDLAAQMAAGPDIGLGDIAGGKLTAEIVAASDFPEVYGVEIMEAMRGRAARVPGGGTAIFGVGGHCALTTITRDGVETRILCEWADAVGSPIDPHAERIAPLALVCLSDLAEVI